MRGGLYPICHWLLSRIIRYALILLSTIDPSLFVHWNAAQRLSILQMLFRLYHFFQNGQPSEMIF